MPVYNTKDGIVAALERLNKRLFNAAFSFKVEQSDSYCVYVLSSFDFAYYVNMTIEFRHITYSNLKENDSWPDAWNADQLFLLTDDKLEEVLQWNDIEYTTIEGLFGFQFNISNQEDYRGITICKELCIHWTHPAFED